MRSGEGGFTLIELLYSTAIISILSAIAFQGFVLYKAQAYDAHTDSLLHDAQVSLTAGRSNFKHGVWDFFWAWTDNTGTLQGWRVDEFLPGVKVTENTRLDANYDGFCEAFAAQWCPGGGLCCMTDWAMARHCDGDTAVTWSRWNDGSTIKMEMANWGC